MVANVSDIRTFQDAVNYIVHQNSNTNTQLVMMCIAFAALVTYLVFYTDTPEALAGSASPLNPESQGGGVLTSILGAIV